MKGNKQIIVNFNRLLSNELFVANQYLLHSRIFQHWGLIRLSKIENQESLDEINHADRYIKRILFLEGSLNNIKSANYCDSYNIKEDVEKILHFDLDLENNTVHDLRECISYADTIRDFVSRDIMINILVDEEKHIDFLETQINLIMRIGIQNYLQSQL